MARLRRVMDAAMVAHVWAQQSQDDARTPRGNFYFDGPTIFSYGSHFPCAMFTEDLHGNKCVLVTERTHSNTTAKHMRHVRDAVRGLDIKVWYVDRVRDRWNNRISHDMHVGNVEKMAQEAAALGESYAKPACSTYMNCEERVRSMHSYAEKISEYCNAFGVEYPWHIFNDITYRERIYREFAEYNSPVKMKVREAYANKREARYQTRMARCLAHKEGVAPPVPWAVVETIPRKLREAYGIPTHFRRWNSNGLWDHFEKTEPEVGITLDEWREGKPGQLREGHRYGWDAPTAVRKRGERLETSRGAEVPFAHAVVAFHRAHRCRRTGTEWHRNGEQIPVGHFQVDMIDMHGGMRAGCHTIKWDEMLRLAVREIPEQVRPTFPLPVII